MSKRQIIMIAAILVVLLTGAGAWFWLGSGSVPGNAMAAGSLPPDSIGENEHTLGSRPRRSP